MSNLSSNLYNYSTNQLIDQLELNSTIAIGYLQNSFSMLSFKGDEAYDKTKKERAKALQIAEESIEAVKNIRKEILQRLNEQATHNKPYGVVEMFQKIKADRELSNQTDND